MTTPLADTSGPPPMIGRRELIAGAGLAALGALFAGPARGSLDVLPFLGDSALPFDRTSIVGQTGDRFRVASGTDRGAVLVLDRVVELPATVADIGQQFAVRFTGPAGLAQDTFEFATDSFGRLPLFISPITEPGVLPAMYEAIVNRHTPAGVTP